jgi:hypothetical protein
MAISREATRMPPLGLCVEKARVASVGEIFTLTMPFRQVICARLGDLLVTQAPPLRAGVM